MLGQPLRFENSVGRRKSCRSLRARPSQFDGGLYLDAEGLQEIVDLAHFARIVAGDNELLVGEASGHGTIVNQVRIFVL